MQVLIFTSILSFIMLFSYLVYKNSLIAVYIVIGLLILILIGELWLISGEIIICF